MEIKDYLIQFYIEQNGETISPDLAKMLVCSFPVTDGSDRKNGEKWTIEETTEAGNKINIDWNKINKFDWYVILNNEYSDKYAIVQKYGLTEPQIYIDFALSWFNDVDGKDNKTFKYFFC